MTKSFRAFERFMCRPVGSDMIEVVQAIHDTKDLARHIALETT
jgi:hypothetical protein